MPYRYKIPHRADHSAEFSFLSVPSFLAYCLLDSTLLPFIGELDGEL